jgi:hypothetical protein
MDENGTGTTMLVQPSGFGGNGGLFGGDLSILVLFFLFMMMGGWGNGFGGGFGGGDLYPWMNQSSQISNGFQNQMLNDSITGIQNGINGITAQLANNQMADMERSFSVQSALQNCCCENRASVADLKYTVATEACADRAAVSDALRNVIESNTANTQRILDKLCAQEIDALKSQNIALQNQVNMQALAASQTAQTAALVADNTAQTQYLVNRIAPYPVPAYTVTNPNTPAI